MVHVDCERAVGVPKYLVLQPLPRRIWRPTGRVQPDTDVMPELEI